MKYVGSKNRLSKQLAPIIQSAWTKDVMAIGSRLLAALI